jgi:Domain of unknown function (DUF1707)
MKPALALNPRAMHGNTLVMRESAALRFPCVVLGEVPVMAGPGDEITAGPAGRGRLRASHADREQVICTLKAAFVQGMLAKDEFDLRVGQAFTSRTHADLAALTADIPPGLAAGQPRQTARDSASMKTVTAVTCGSAAFASMVTAVAVAIHGDSSNGERLVALAVLVPFAVMVVTALVLFHAWLERRAGRRSALGPPPGAGGQASQRSVPAHPAGQLPQTRRAPRQAGGRNPGGTVSHRRGRSEHIRPGQGRMPGEAAVSV